MNIKEIVEYQNSLNTKTCGEDWVKGVCSKTNRNINWYLAIHMEAAEAIDCFPWKHWKSVDSGVDIDNLKIELVDIFHFIISQLITSTGIETTTAILEQYIKSNRNVKMFDWENYIIFNLEKLSLHAIKENINFILDTFFEIIGCIPGFNIEELLKIYIGKNVLNEFRQNNGYKEGTYIKLWDGKNEDNVFMLEIISDMDTLCFDDVNKALEDKYKKLIQGV